MEGTTAFCVSWQVKKAYLLLFSGHCHGTLNWLKTFNSQSQTVSWVPIQHLVKYFRKYIFFSFTSIYILRWSLSAFTQLSQSGGYFIFAGNWNFVRIKKPKSLKRNTKGYVVMNGLKLRIARQTVQVWLQNWLYKTTFSCNRYFSFRYTFCNNSLSYVWKKAPS